MRCLAFISQLREEERGKFKKKNEDLAMAVIFKRRYNEIKGMTDGEQLERKISEENIYGDGKIVHGVLNSDGRVGWRMLLSKTI